MLITRTTGKQDERLRGTGAAFRKLVTHKPTWPVFEHSLFPQLADSVTTTEQATCWRAGCCVVTAKDTGGCVHKELSSWWGRWDRTQGHPAGSVQRNIRIPWGKKKENSSGIDSSRADGPQQLLQTHRQKQPRGPWDQPWRLTQIPRIGLKLSNTVSSGLFQKRCRLLWESLWSTFPLETSYKHQEPGPRRAKSLYVDGGSGPNRRGSGPNRRGSEIREPQK